MARRREGRKGGGEGAEVESGQEEINEVREGVTLERLECLIAREERQISCKKAPEKLKEKSKVKVKYQDI